MASARSAPAPANPQLPFYRTPLFAAGLIVVAAALAYHNSFFVPFVFDDEPAIVSNPSLRHLWTAWRPPEELRGLPISGRPVVNFSLGVNYAISGTAVWSYHVVNLLIHLAAGIALFGVVRRTLLQPGLVRRFGTHAFELALLVATLWTVHPLQTESVTYISQRAESLLGLWYLLTLWCFIRALEPGASTAWPWLAFVTCLLGMLTKEVMISAPLFAALYDRTFVAGSWREAWARHRKLLLALASTWLLLAWVVAREGGARGLSAGFGLGVPWWSYLLKQCEAILLYLKLSFWPHPLVLDYGTGVVRVVTDVWWQALVLLALLTGTIGALIRKPAIGCLGAWFFMILAPSSSVLPLVGQTMAEHRMYLPLAAVVVLLVLAAYAQFGRKSVVILAMVAAVLAMATMRRNEDYASAISIGEDTVAKRPDNARAMALLADYDRRAGRLDDARQWLERSLTIEPGIPAVLNNLGFVWQGLGDVNKAVICFRQALARKPGDIATLNNLGNALIVSGDVAEGIAQIEAALDRAPDSIDTRANLANALAQASRMAEAAAHFEILANVRPDDVELRVGYGNVLLALGRGGDAIKQFGAAVRLQPGNADLHNLLGVALGRTGRLREALAEFQEAMRVNPAHQSARQNAERAQRRLGGN